jgi:BolA protein
MSVTQEIREKITQELAPEEFDLVDESESHRGHAGYQEGGESHFRLRIKAASLSGLSRIAQHRAIHAAIGADLIGKIHALAIHVER